MADDLTQRSFRLSDRPERPKTSSGTDPLAELARLIGQTDPFGEFGRDQVRPGRVTEPAAARAPSAEWTMPSAPNWNARPSPVPGYPPPRVHAPEPASRADFGEPGERKPDALHADNDAHEHEPLVDDTNIAPIEGAHEDFYDEEPRRRTGVIAVAAVFALAVIGTAGAFGYRALFSNSGAVPPVVIKADPKPIKVEAARSENTKPMQDRAPSGERLVTREEKPVELKDKTSATILGSQVNPPPGAAPPTGAISTEPKKIHTIAIRPDGAVIEPSAPPAAPPATTRVPAPPPRPPMAQPQQERVVEAAPRNGPLSLNPNAPAAPAPPPAPARPAPAAPPVAAAPPPAAAPVAPAPSGATSGYAVQISSQRSEAEAQAAYRSLQAKFPSQLGAHQPLIRRVELGEKGVYFRAMVGPFASSDEAIKLCTSLKSAGASCIVQKI